MPRRSKISVVIVLGLGILASIAALMRIISYQYIDTRNYPNDHMVAQGRLVLWSIFESSLAIIACSLPPLKKLISNIIGRSLGRSTSPSRPSVSDPVTFSAVTTTPLFVLTGVQQRLDMHADETPLQQLTPHGRTRTLVTGKAKWDRLHDDDSSGGHITKQMEVSVERGSPV